MYVYLYFYYFLFGAMTTWHTFYNTNTTHCTDHDDQWFFTDFFSKKSYKDTYFWKLCQTFFKKML